MIFIIYTSLYKPIAALVSTAVAVLKIILILSLNNWTNSVQIK